MSEGSCFQKAGRNTGQKFFLHELQAIKVQRESEKHAPCVPGSSLAVRGFRFKSREGQAFVSDWVLSEEVQPLWILRAHPHLARFAIDSSLTVRTATPQPTR